MKLFTEIIICQTLVITVLKNSPKLYMHTAPGDIFNKAAMITTNFAKPPLGDRTDRIKPPRSAPPLEPSSHSGVTRAEEANTAPNVVEINLRLSDRSR